MTDILDRLREYPMAIYGDAADEIETLRARVAELETANAKIPELMRFKWNDEQLRIAEDRVATLEKERDEAREYAAAHIAQAHESELALCAERDAAEARVAELENQLECRRLLVEALTLGKAKDENQPV